MFRSVLWKIRIFARKFWVRAALVSCLAIVAAALAPFSHYLPIDLSTEIDEDTLEDLLSILNNSMLAVTTFSLSIMVSAHLAAGGNATPRAHRLLQQDGRTQTVIATFIGAFIYAVTMTVMLNLGFFWSESYAIIYIITVAVLALLIVAILRWVAHLAGLGSVEATIARVQERAEACLRARASRPFLGGRDIDGVDIPESAPAFHAATFGYVQNIDVEQLNKHASAWAARIFVTVAPGEWVGAGRVMGYVDVETLDETQENALCAAIAVGDRREYDQDAAFALNVLAEIAERALSPGINDPRTALDVVGRLTKMIAEMPPEREDDAPPAPAIYCRRLDTREILLDTLDPIARDGKNFVEVQLSVQRAYALLAEHRDRATADAAIALSARALSYAREGVSLIEDLQRIAKVAPAGHMATTSAGEPEHRVSDVLGDESPPGPPAGA